VAAATRRGGRGAAAPKTVRPAVDEAGDDHAEAERRQQRQERLLLHLGLQRGVLALALALEAARDVVGLLAQGLEPRRALALHALEGVLAQPHQRLVQALQVRLELLDVGLEPAGIGVLGGIVACGHVDFLPSSQRCFGDPHDVRQGPARPSPG
jgi:hypothetical protein